MSFSTTHPDISFHFRAQSGCQQRCRSTESNIHSLVSWFRFISLFTFWQVVFCLDPVLSKSILWVPVHSSPGPLFKIVEWSERGILSIPQSLLLLHFTSLENLNWRTSIHTPDIWIPIVSSQFSDFVVFRRKSQYDISFVSRLSFNGYRTGGRDALFC